MGDYTRVYNANGDEVQIYAGDEMWREYRIGDTVDWSINPNKYGEVSLLDGAYEGYGPDGMWWVVIKDHKVVNVVPGPDPDFNLDEDTCPYEQARAFEEELYERYGLKRLTGEEYRALFTPEALARYDAECEQRKREHEEFMATIAHLSPEEQFRELMCQPLKASLNYQAIGRSLLIGVRRLWKCRFGPMSTA